MHVPNLVTVVPVAGLAADASTCAVRESLRGVPDVHRYQPYEGASTHPMNARSTAPLALAWECVLDYVSEVLESTATELQVSAL